MDELTLDKENKKILGVCSGLSKYFEIDVTILRVFFLFSAIVCFGFTALLYLIIALVAPCGTKNEVQS
jgi:phage shock protein PspC (stress-responsive transcriptional regulator)